MPGMRFAIYKFEKETARDGADNAKQPNQKIFNGLQFRNHRAVLLRAGRVVSLNGYIFVNSARFSTVSKRAACVTLRQRSYKIVFTIKNT
jgi:hypothetical protein